MKKRRRRNLLARDQVNQTGGQLKNSLLAVFVLGILLIQGCASWQEADSHRYAPKIGMTKAEVLGSVWSSPRRVNKTTTASGTSEIWFYAGPSFLFFDEHGILSRIDSPFLGQQQDGRQDQEELTRRYKEIVREDDLRRSRENSK